MRTCWYCGTSDPLAELRATVLALRSAGYVDTTLGSFVADAIAERIVRWQRGELGPTGSACSCRRCSRCPSRARLPGSRRA